MRVIICGSRAVDNLQMVGCAVKLWNALGHSLTEVITGMAKGIDMNAYAWAVSTKTPVRKMPVTKEDWAKHGRSAGHKRNDEMLSYVYPDGGVIAIVDPDSKTQGARSIAEKARKMGMPVLLITMETPIKWEHWITSSTSDYMEKTENV